MDTSGGRSSLRYNLSLNRAPQVITNLSIQNFKGICHAKIKFGRLAVIVGPNASGKTTILQVLNYLTEQVGSWKLQTWPPTHFIDIKDSLYGSMLNLGFSDEQLSTLKMELACRTDKHDLRIIFFSKSEWNNLKSPNYWICDCQADGSIDWNSRAVPPPESNAARYSLGTSRLFRFDPSVMVEPSFETGDMLASNGRGLASTLAYMALNQPEMFTNLQRELISIIPNIKRIRFDRVKSNNSINESLVFDTKNGGIINASAASEGTLLVLGLLTALNVSYPPNIILVDDLDRGLHPLAQRKIIDLLRKILEQQPDLQIVATTHSPYLVDSLKPEEVLMTTLREDGSVACGRLDEHPDFARWKDEFLPGEMWSMFGEKWVADLAPEVAK